MTECPVKSRLEVEGAARGGGGGGPGGGQEGLEELEVRRRFDLHKGLNNVKLPVADQKEEILEMIGGKSSHSQWLTGMAWQGVFILNMGDMI